MPLTSLKLLEKTADALKQESLSPVNPSQPQFPYGSKLCFEKEQIELLPVLKLLDVGQKVSITGEGRVVMKRQGENQSEKPDFTVEIQIEGIDIQQVEKKPAEKLSPEEYRIMREGKLL